MKISIITPTFNSEKTLRDTINSILGQTFEDYEVWIVDGGSKDSTVEIIKEMQPMFNGRLHYVSEPDRGIYDAMNKGIALSTGDVVGILNSDDFYTSNDVLQTVADAFAKAPSLDATYGDIHFVNSDDLATSVRYYSSRIFKPCLMRWGYMPAHPSFYIKRSVYDEVGGYSLDYKIASDYEMMVRLFCKRGINSLYIPKDFVTMRTGGTSTGSVWHRILTTHEDAKACRSNGIFSCFPMCCVKYFTKVFEFKGMVR